MNKVTVNDVALMAGVSKSSVSNFFNSPSRLSEPTRDRIRETVERLQFVPNDAARQLRSGTNPVIGYIAFELTSAFTPEIARSIEQKVSARGMHVLMANDDGSSERERSYIELFEMQRVSGLIVAPIGDIEEQLLRLKRRGTPSVLSARKAKSPHLAWAAADGVAGGYIAAKHLLSLGRRRLGFVTSSLELQQLTDRMQGALKAIQEVPGALFEVINVSERSVAAGAYAAGTIAARPQETRPDALFCANDLLAIGVVQHLTSTANVSVPEDIAVMGYDDIEFAQSMAVPLSTIRVSGEALGAAAVELLFEEMDLIAKTKRGELPQVASRHVLFQPELIIRQSTTNR